MPTSASRRSRPMSAGQLQELYGVPVPQLRNSEHAFRKELFKRDKDRLKMRVAAIDNERKHVERKWDKEMTRFTREHAELMDSNRKKSAHRKKRAMSSLFDGFIPPNVSSLGTFPPFRHPVHDRQTEETFHGQEAVRHEQDNFEYNGNKANKISEKTPSQDNHRIHNSQYVSHPFHAASLVSARSSDRRNSSNGHFHNNNTCFSADCNRTSSVDNGNQTLKNFKFQSWLSHNNENNNHTFSEPLTSDKSELFIHSGPCRKRNTGTNSVSNACTRFGGNDNDNRNNGTVHLETADNGNFLTTTSTQCHFRKNSRSGNEIAMDDQKIMKKRWSPVYTGKSSSNMNAASRENDSNRVFKSEPGQRHASSSGGSPSNDSGTSGSFDVEMLQQALKEHSSKCLIRNRWHHATQNVLLQISNEQDDETTLSPLGAFSLQVHPPSALPSVTPPLPVARPLSVASRSTDLSESQPDSGEMVVQAILQFLKELDHTLPKNLAQMWPIKMEILMTTIENLVKTTNVEIMAIVEKIQKEDLHDEKSAALLNWVKNVDNATIVTDHLGKNDTMDMATDRRRRHSVKFPDQYRERSYERRKHKDKEVHVKPTDAFQKNGESSGKHKNQPSVLSSNQIPPSPMKAGRNRLPVTNIVPPSRGNILSAEEENSGRRCQSAGADHLQNTGRLESLQGKGAEQHGQGKTPQLALYSSTALGKETEGLLLKRRRSKSSDCRTATRAPVPRINPDDRRSSFSLLHRAITVKHPSSELQMSSKLPEMTPAQITASSPDIPRMMHSTAEDSQLHCAKQKPSPRRANTDSSDRDTLQSRSSTRLSISAASSVYSSTNVQTLSNDDSFRSKSTRKVSFSDFSTTTPTSDSDEKRKVGVQNGFTISDQRRSETFSSIRPLSSQSCNTKSIVVHRRVSSTDQHLTRKPSTNGSVYRANCSQRKPTTSKLSSAAQQRKGSTGDSNSSQSSSQHDSSKCELPACVTPEERQETIQTLLHTDRKGKTHLLTMRKVSLVTTGIREANVFVTREDTGIKSPTPSDVDSDQKIDHNCKDGVTGNGDIDIPDIVVDKVSSDDSVTGMVGDELDGNLDNFPEETSSCHEEHIPECSQSESHDPEITPVEADDADCTSPDEEERLWWRRLTHPNTMPWVQELSCDHKAQGLALSLLQRKERGGRRFRSTVLKVICVNALRAAKRVYDDVTYREMKHCRYLRMPESYMADTQRTLSIMEIFS